MCSPGDLLCRLLSAKPLQPLWRQKGASLIVCLLMLLVVLMLGTSAAHVALLEAKSSRNDLDRQIALETAEAALADAELDIETSDRRHVFSDSASEGFEYGCARGLDNRFLGLCLPSSKGDVPVWRRVDLADDEGSSSSAPYGHFTGRMLQTGEGLLPARRPRYIIEQIPYAGPGGRMGGGDRTQVFRITSIGFGTRTSTRVVLQAFYRRRTEESTPGAAADIPRGRLSWREIPNWQEMHDAIEED